jgi:hypothetical protein
MLNIWVFTYLLYFIAILQWSIGHPFSASIGGDFWLELVVRQMIFSRIPSKQCASRWQLWGNFWVFGYFEILQNALKYFKML